MWLPTAWRNSGRRRQSKTPPVRQLSAHHQVFGLPLLKVNPNRSLDRYSAIRYREDNFLPSFIFLLASCFLLVLDVARYAFELTNNHLLNNLMKSVQDLMTDLG